MARPPDLRNVKVTCIGRPRLEKARNALPLTLAEGREDGIWKSAAQTLGRFALESARVFSTGFALNGIAGAQKPDLIPRPRDPRKGLPVASLPEPTLKSSQELHEAEREF